MNFINLFSIQSVVTIFLFFSVIRVRAILMLPCIFFTWWMWVLCILVGYTLYKVYISLQHSVLILRKIFLS